jgi:hypothetical protein
VSNLLTVNEDCDSTLALALFDDNLETCKVAKLAHLSGSAVVAGTYKQNAKFFNNRPCYSRSGSQMFAYYDRDNYWRIGPTLGGSQVMAQTHCPALNGRGLFSARWKIWDFRDKKWAQDKNFRFVSEFFVR